MQIDGRRYDSGEPVRVQVAHGRIAAIVPLEGSPVAELPWLAPGLFDIQINGYGGQEFSSAELTVPKVLGIARRMGAFGVTRFCPTVTTQSFEVLRHGLETIHAACEVSPQAARQMPVIHLEGPYISAEDGPRGAHPPEHCRPPDWEEFERLQEAAQGRIRLLTMAVESDEAPVFIRRAVQSGVIVAIGHTGANAGQIRNAVDAGARLSTHLGNGSHERLPRHRNYIWDQLAEDRLWASVIGDAQHLPLEVLKCFLRVKTPSRTILISDLSGMAGLPPGRYGSRLCDLEILEDGRLVIAGQRQLLAGASFPLGVAVANVVRSTGYDLATAIEMASDRPAALLGLAPAKLEVGADAELIQFRLPDDGAQQASFEVLEAILDGKSLMG